MTPVIIVGFRNAPELVQCLRALARVAACSDIEVYVCENGGTAAFDTLTSVLTAEGVCVADDMPPRTVGARLRRACQLRLVVEQDWASVTVHVGEAVENLGYAGGVNAWLNPLLDQPDWSAIWVLNPDSEPAPTALLELESYARTRQKDMVGSRLTTKSDPGIVQTRGLAWRKWRAATLSVDLYSPATVSPKPDEVDRRLDAPSGASLYVTRDCIERIGLMQEDYFLYFEDLDWGIRAKQGGSVGYAHQSVVYHQGGTTIGTSTSRRTQSPLSVYLDFRNRILFVQRHFATWLPWTLLTQVAELVLYLRLRAFANARAAFGGMLAGLAGQSGRPDKLLRGHVNRDQS